MTERKIVQHRLRRAGFANQAGAAEAIGVSQNAISCWLRRIYAPKGDTLARILGMLGPERAAFLTGVRVRARRGN